MKDFDRAVASYSEAIRLKPSYAQAYVDRGVVQYLAGRFDDAIADYGEALKINPNHAPTYFNRGSVYRGIGMTQKAITDYRKALELDPNSDAGEGQAAGTRRAVAEVAAARVDGPTNGGR